jgi:membrane protease YdiL (CAAX protease family)
MHVEPETSPATPVGGSGPGELIQPDRSPSPLSRMMHTYTGMMKRHPIVAGLVFIVTAAVLVESVWFGNLTGRVVYVAAMACGVLLADFVIGRERVRPDPLPVRRPGPELSVALVCLLITELLLMNAKQWHWHYDSPTFRLANGISLVFFLLWQAPLLILFFAVMKYRLKDLGFRLYALLLPVLILLCFAALASMSHTWVSTKWIWNEFGSVTNLIEVSLLAAFSEEFLRMTWQTRLSALLKNPATAWFLTAWIWSLVHFPNYGSLRSCLEIVPEGLMWGYVMFRTRSLLPTMILHLGNFMWAFKMLR